MVPAVGTPLKFATGGSLLNIAVTAVLTFIVSWHAPVPVQPPPLQPAKDESDAEAAVRVTGVLAQYCAVQLVPQLMPPVDPVTVPVPAPLLPTVNVLTP